MSDNILVAVRLRPLINREVSDAASVHWQIGAHNTIVQIDPKSAKALCAPYKFDRAYGMDYNNEDIYFEVAEGIVESAIAGFNGTIFAYGQTSSGKTYTMMGDKEDPGVIPLAIQNIFQSIENNPNREYLIRVSYMEIYNETITDLLAAVREQKGKGLAVREDTTGAVYVVDLKEEVVNSEEMLLNLMKRGNKYRHVGATNMNERSSRSHTIFRVILESRERTEGDGTDEAITVSHLNLVDLAGSENASQTGATGERLKEGGYINKSLFMLGRVISQLSEGEQFVNFRDSKLTRILQLSLGGNAKTAIICTVTPVGVEQTHSTLRFASRAKSVKNKPIVNEVLSDTALLKRYAKEIKNLQVSLEKERNTDKAQEVEQVREMLDEKERINQELLGKLNALKEKLVVSSHPRETSKEGTSKKKKMRRETWAAPAVRRAMRMSMAAVRIQPIDLDHEFLHPKLPPWTELLKISEEESIGKDSASSSPESVYPDVDSSVVSDGFGREDSFLDMAEQSKLGKLETSFDKPESANRKPWKRVHFRLSNHEGVTDAECQTEDSLLPQLKLLPQDHNPGTPVHVLRARNVALSEEVNKKDEWLKEWQKEIEELTDFQKAEMLLLEESFQRKVADGPVDYTKLEEKQKEINHLKHSLLDSEALLLDANRNLSQKTRELTDLQQQVIQLTEKSSKLDKVEKDFSLMKVKFEEVQKIMNEKEERLTQLENERNDFDTMMELALQKQTVKEKDLRKSLNDAWKELAAHEDNDVQEVKNRHQRMSVLEAEVLQLREVNSTLDQSSVSVGDIEKQLEEALAKQQAAEHKLEEQNIKLSQVSVLEKRLQEMETEISQMEILKTELHKAEHEVKTFKKENADLKEETSSLQLELNQKEIPDVSNRIQELELEVELLREKLDEEVNSETVSLPSQADTTASRISRKLSETLQALEESMIFPCTPRKDSAGDVEPFIQPQDVAIIKQQLLALQEALIAQELQYQSQRSLQVTTKDALIDQRICSEIVAEMEAEAGIWRVAESFYTDYIFHAVPPYQHQYNSVTNGTASDQEVTLNRKSVGFPNIDRLVQESVEEARANIQHEYDEKFKEARAALEVRLSEDTFIEGDTLYIPSDHCDDKMTSSESDAVFYTPTGLCDNDITSPQSMEMTINDGVGSPIVDNLPELQSLKEQMQLLKDENSTLASQMELLKKELSGSRFERTFQKDSESTASKDDIDKEQNVSIEDSSVSDSLLLASRPLGGVQSLADELREAGMNLSSGDDVFETSVLDIAPSPIQENESLKHQVQLLNAENCTLKSQILHLQTELKNSDTSVNTTDDSLVVRTCDQQNFKTLEEELKNVLSEKSNLEVEIDNLQEELSNAEMTNEEVYSLRWKVESLKEEKSDLEEDLKIVESFEDRKSSDVDIHEKCKEDMEKIMRELEEIREENKKLAASQEVVSMEKLGNCDNEPSEGRLEDEIENSKIAESLDKMTDELKTKEKALQEAKEELETMKMNMSLQMKEMQDAKDTYEELKQTLNDKSKELDEVKGHLDTLTSSAKAQEETRMTTEETLLATAENAQKELGIAQEKIKSLLQEQDNQHKHFEDRIANIIDEKDNELEVMITNFTEKEEAFENKISNLEESNKKIPEISITHERELKIENLSQKCSSLQTTIDNLESSLAKKECQLSTLEGTHLELQKELSDASMQYDIQLQEMKETIRSYEEERNVQINAVEAAKKKYDEREGLIEAIEVEKEQLKQDFDAAKKKYDEREGLIEAIEVEKEQLKQDFDAAKKKYDEREGLIAAIEVEKEQLKQDFDAAKKKYDEREGLIAAIEVEKEQLKQDFDAAKKKYNEREGLIAAIEMEKEQLKQDFDAAKKYDEREGLIVAIEVEKEQLKQDFDAAKKKYDEREGLIAAIEVEKEQLKQDFDAAKKKYDEREGLIAAIEVEKQQLKQDFDAAIATLEEQKSLLKEREEERAALVDSYEKQLSERNKPNENQDVSEENQRMLKKLDELEDLKNDYSIKVRECNQLKDSLANLEILRAKNEEKLSSLSEEHCQEVAAYSEHLEKRDEQIRCLECEVKEKTGTVTSLATAVEAKEHEVKHLKKEIEELKDSREKLQFETDEIIVSTQTEMSDKVKELETEIERLTRLSDEVCDDRKNMMDAMNDKENAAKQLLSENEALKCQVQNLQDERDQLQDDCDSKQTKILQKVEEIILLEAEQQKLKEEATNLKSLEKEMNEQHDSDNHQIEKLVAIIEKFETNMTKKEEELHHALKWEAEVAAKEENLRASKVETETLTSRISDMESTVKNLQDENEDLKKSQTKLEKELESTVKNLQDENENLKKSQTKLEKELANTRTRSDDMDNLSEKLAAAENKLLIVQSDFDAKMELCKEEISVHVSEKKNLCEKLAATEEELKKVFLEYEEGKERLKTVMEELNEKNATLELVTKARDTIATELNTLKQELSSVTEVLKRTELEMLQQTSQINSLTSEKQALEESLKDKKLQEKEFKAQQESNNQQVDKLVRIIEKFETETSEKYEQMLIKDKKHESEISEKDEKLKSLMLEVTSKSSQVAEAEETIKHLQIENETLVLKLHNLKELEEKCLKLEEELAEQKKLLSDVRNLPSEENSRLDTQSNAENELEEYKKTFSTYLSENEDLRAQLSNAEERIKTVEGELQKIVHELENKAIECSKLDAEMDDLVKHYEKEIIEKREYYEKEIIEKSEVIGSLTEDFKKIESELSETKERNMLSHTHLDATTDASSSAAVQEVSELRNEVKTLREELAMKEQKCNELDKEMDEIVEHFKKEGSMYCQELEKASEEFEKTKSELNETKMKLLEVTLRDESLMDKSEITMHQNSLQSSEQKNEMEMLQQQKTSSDDEVNTLKTKYSKLKEKYCKMEDKCQELKRIKTNLQEEVKLGNSTTDSLLERLGDLEKFKVIWLEEKDSLSSKIKEYKNEIEVLKMSIPDQNAGKQIGELLHKVTSMEKELEIGTKKYDILTNECAEWKMEYTKQLEECERLKEQIKNGEMILNQQKLEYEEKIDDLSTRLNTHVNTSVSNTSTLDLPKGGKKAKVAALVKQRDSLLDLTSDLTAKNETLEKHLDNLRQSGGVVSTVEEFQLELALMRKKIEEVESERDLLNKNYDILEKDFEALQNEQEKLQCMEKAPESSVDNSALEQLHRENTRLQEEISLLRETANLKATKETVVEDSDQSNLEDRLLVLERENNELRFRLRALNAPAEKEVESLKGELANANAKVTHLKAELRRIQNSNNVDSTICEMKGAPVRARMFDTEGGTPEPAYDYRSKSGVVSEVQVMILQNKVYHLEKEEKKVKHEYQAMEQHVDHYKKKAQEWKDTTFKERRTAEKTKKEADLWRTETSKLKKEIEDLRSTIERQQFEIGSQRELIDRLEKEKKKQLQQPQPEKSFSSAMSRRKSMMPPPIKEEDNRASSSSEGIIEENKISVSTEVTPAAHLRVHNAPLPSQTRVERLPFAKPSDDAQSNHEEKQPLWKKDFKENKDYSKYYLPPGSTQKKKDEDCKVQ